MTYRYVSDRKFAASKKEEVSFTTGEFMHVLKKMDQCLLVRLVRNGQEGLVPTSHVTKFKPLDDSE